MDYGQLGQEFSQLLIQVTSELMNPTQPPKNLSKMERKLRAKLLEVGQFILTAWLSTLDERYPTDTKPCPHCEGEAEYKFKRAGTLQTMLGEIKYDRHYYLCPRCHQGFYPLDCQLGLRPGEISAEEGHKRRARCRSHARGTGLAELPAQYSIRPRIESSADHSRTGE